MSLSFLDLFDISEVEIELMGSNRPEKILEIGRIRRDDIPGNLWSISAAAMQSHWSYGQKHLAFRVSGLNCVQRWLAVPVRRSPSVGSQTGCKSLKGSRLWR